MEDGIDLGRRVFYTLDDKNPEIHRHRNTKAIALLFKHLHEKKMLSDEAIDEILLDCVSG